MMLGIGRKASLPLWMKPVFELPLEGIVASGGDLYAIPLSLIVKQSLILAKLALSSSSGSGKSKPTQVQPQNENGPIQNRWLNFCEANDAQTRLSNSKGVRDVASIDLFIVRVRCACDCCVWSSCRRSRTRIAGGRRQGARRRRLHCVPPHKPDHTQFWLYSRGLERVDGHDDRSL